MTLDKLTREYLKAREELILSHARAGRNMTQAAMALGTTREALWNLIARNDIPWPNRARSKQATGGR